LFLSYNAIPVVTKPQQGFVLLEGDGFVHGHGPTRLEVVDRLLDRFLLLFIIAAPFYFDA
jgi:hypothetical protein